MKYYSIILALAMTFLGAQAVQAQTVLERFPIDRSTCTGGISVSAYFDNGNGSNKDWNCGSKTYSKHKGTDFAPYGNTRNSCHVVAAAPGKVLSTKDGLVDNRSSAGSSNPDCSNGNSYGNHVKIQQNDGSVVVYAHMKKGSIKVKSGQTVTCGQQLGVAQSSGCSTGTHLHFDIAPKNGGTRFDPFKGSCGSSSSRWVSQGSYKGLPGDSCQCIPNCSGKSCGDNGCGGSCGSCASNQTCQNNQCVCVPNCNGKSCGDNGCGGSCGSCKSNETCSGNKCVCVPNCNGKSCGDDGCGGSCGSCKSNETCSGNKCVCAPNCNGKSCGDDGCGGSCGSCKSNEVCTNNACVCVPNCDGKSCGDDGCGGSCGQCKSNEVCTDNACVCVPNCDGKSCGDDGCGGSCGSCKSNEVCTDNACVCVPNCDGKSCGDDSCGGACGECKSNEVCTDNACVCVPNCDGKSCGDDGCGGSCGQCSECSDNEAPTCAGSRVKSCKNGEYVYTSCGPKQSCQKGACVDDPNADPNIKQPMVEMVYDGCSATWSSRTGSASLAFLMLILGVILRRRREIR